LYSPAVADQRRRVLAEAGAAPADAGLQEPRADPLVEPDAASHLGDVGADLAGQLADFVDIADLQGEEAFAAYLISSAEARSVETSGTAPMSSGRGRKPGVVKVWLMIGR